MKQPSREITLVIDRAGWNTRLSEHKCSIAWNIILSLNWTCRGSRMECTALRRLIQLLLGLFRSLESDQSSEIGGRSYCEARSAVKNQAVLDWPEGEPVETCTKDGVLLSASLPKDFLYLSPILLKKRMSSPIRKFAHKGIAGSSIDLIFYFDISK